MKRIFPFLFSFLVLCLTGCTAAVEAGYTQIDQETAKEMMAMDGTQIVVDVRTQEEYDSGHIPGAICIPNESITTEKPEQLPDLDQIILIYCRSGNWSKQAAQKLASMGYTNIYGKVWNTKRNHFGWWLYLRKDAKEAVSPYAAPANQTDYSKLPPCYTFVGDGELFYAETLAYVENLRVAGVEAEVDVYHTDMHAFDMLRDDDLSREAIETFERKVGSALEKVLR